jgi:hypothetical protein
VSYCSFIFSSYVFVYGRAHTGGPGDLSVRCRRFRQLGSIEDSERLSVRAIAGNAPRHYWHLRQRGSFGICKLQNLKDP